MAEEKKIRQKDGEQDQKKEGSTSMVAPHPLAESSFADLAKKNKIGPLAAGVKRTTGWDDKTEVTEKDFTKALNALKSKPLGGGRRKQANRL